MRMHRLAALAAAMGVDVRQLDAAIAGEGAVPPFRLSLSTLFPGLHSALSFGRVAKHRVRNRRRAAKRKAQLTALR